MLVYFMHKAVEYIFVRKWQKMYSAISFTFAMHLQYTHFFIVSIILNECECEYTTVVDDQL